MAISVNTGRQLAYIAERLMRSIFVELGFSTKSEVAARFGDAQVDVLVRAKVEDLELLFVLAVKSRITPQTAFAVCQQLARLKTPAIPLIFAPVISPRVAEIAMSQGIGFLDGAGNCWIKSPRHRLLIERKGLTAPRLNKEASADPFSPKSSRIVRALLSQPRVGWQVRELAAHPEVAVSAGLVSKVRKALIEQGYAIECQKRLRLLDPIALLRDWCERYSGPVEQIGAYFRGDLDAAEAAIGSWAHKHGLRVARAGLSAAWQQAPEVRHSVATLYVEERGFDPELLGQLADKQGVKRVDSGANVLLWRPYDSSVFASAQTRRGSDMPATSPLQTYLDAKRLAGRGEEAAKAIFDKYLKLDFEAAAEMGKAFQREPL